MFHVCFGMTALEHNALVRIALHLSSFRMQSYDCLPRHQGFIFCQQGQNSSFCSKKRDFNFIFDFLLLVAISLTLAFKVLVYECVIDRSPCFALIATSDPMHAVISSRCELVRFSTRELPARERKRATSKAKTAFVTSAEAQKVQKLDIPIEQTLSWHLSLLFNEDPLLRQNLKDGARYIAGTIHSPEILFQTLQLRNHLGNSVLDLLKITVIPRLDAAIASAFVDIGIGPVLEHASFSCLIFDTLLDVWLSQKHQKILPEVFKFLQKCCSDIMRGQASKNKTFAALPRLFMSVSHGFGCSSSAAIDMIFRHIAPLANEQSHGGKVMQQLIVPRFLKHLHSFFYHFSFI